MAPARAAAKKAPAKATAAKASTKAAAAKAPAKAAVVKKHKAADPIAAPAKKGKGPKGLAHTPSVTPPPAKAAAGRKRKADDDVAPPAKKAKALTHGESINDAPVQPLNVFVFGEGSSGELGLGNTKKPPSKDVKRPRLNPYLTPDKVGAVQVAAGGMHTIVLTHDNKILTWGVNDQGALGRDTAWEGGLKDVDAASDDSDDDDDGPGDNGLNPREATPAEVDWSTTELAEGTRFTEVTAGDSASFALTDDGKVYGWGTFRGNDGIIGFTPEVHIATRPILINGLKDITTIKAGMNHCLALDKKGRVHSWGCGQQDQLGRRVIERTAKAEGLKPRDVGLPKGPKKAAVAIAVGTYNGWAILKNGDVYAWGLNSMDQTGIPTGEGDTDATIRPAQRVPALSGIGVTSIAGGGQHAIAATESGDCLVWGRVDADQAGIPVDELSKLPEDILRKDDRGRPRILKVPQKVTAITGNVFQITAGTDHNIAVTKEGKAWSWGFSANYQTGQGTDDDVKIATMIDNTAVREQKLNAAAAGGQFSIVTASANTEMVNGV
ncbi:regulator of chromosome condensation 1/beta-lactamase-inhibitor protein II [Neohortaea acidophila]|uniref:Regulator of chromosome condensation 1/beta-lactamase-inhibitor protein II n=1 Tax=Neohortaea acidophila TaxID=245834 RepID=A0A6A6Q636_9PEZI|nr:regulator of chromosome condensation 1/beta-lactamase-inhibitor protein II [Neohortaea acidophila]KAF2487752.1 regulator of chromosome condensation 1/beta-lactamase-inhibitor protein II [Neohortaea acidophila]